LPPGPKSISRRSMAAARSGPRATAPGRLSPCQPALPARPTSRPWPALHCGRSRRAQRALCRCQHARDAGRGAG
jgi:hypothetical protein